MTDDATKPRRRSLLRSPAATLLLGGLLLADVLTLPPETTAGAFMHEHVHPVQLGCSPRPPLVYLVNEGGTLRLAEFNDPAAFDYRAGRGDPEVHRAILSCEPEVTRTGFWAITRAEFDHTMTVRPLGGDALRPEEASRARAMFVPYAVENGLTPESGQHMTRADGVKSLIRWDGYLRNAASLVVALGLLASLRWVID